jgi:hypothetical protein
MGSLPYLFLPAEAKTIQERTASNSTSGRTKRLAASANGRVDVPEHPAASQKAWGSGFNPSERDIAPASKLEPSLGLTENTPSARLKGHGTSKDSGWHPLWRT